MIYRRLLSFEPGHIAARLALAGILEKDGRLPEALALFPKGLGPEAEARVALLQVKNHQPEDALAALERIPAGQQAAAALAVAGALAAKDERKLARSLIQGALGRNTEVRMNFPLQTKLVELLTPEDGPPVALRELRRLRRMAGESPDGLLGNYLEVAAQQAARLHVAKDFTRELAALWAEGAGQIPAGAVILTAQLTAGDRKAAETTLAQLLAREDLIGPAPGSSGTKPCGAIRLRATPRSFSLPPGSSSQRRIWRRRSGRCARRLPIRQTGASRRSSTG